MVPYRRRTVLTTGVALLTLSGSLLAGHAAWAQTVTNGSFEAVQIGSPFNSANPADIPGWTHTGSQGDALLWAIGYADSGGSITTAGAGNQFVTLGGGFGASDTGFWSQDVTGFTVGQTYTLSFMMASEAPGLNQSITVDFPTGSLTGAQTFTAGPSDANYWRVWESKSMNFVPTAATVTLRFAATTQFDVGLDNVGVTLAAAAAPEPTSLLLVSLGVGLVALRARRHRPRR